MNSPTGGNADAPPSADSDLPELAPSTDRQLPAVTSSQAKDKKPKKKSSESSRKPKKSVDLTRVAPTQARSIRGETFTELRTAMQPRVIGALAAFATTIGLVASIAQFVESDRPIDLLAEASGVAILAMTIYSIATIAVHGRTRRWAVRIPALLALVLTFALAGAVVGAVIESYLPASLHPKLSERDAEPVSSPSRTLESIATSPPSPSASVPTSPATTGTAVSNDSAPTSHPMIANRAVKTNTKTTPSATTENADRSNPPVMAPRPSAKASLTKPSTGDHVAQCAVIEGTSSNLPQGMTLVTAKHQSGKDQWFIERPTHWAEPSMLDSWTDTQTFNNANGHSFTIYVYLVPLDYVKREKAKSANNPIWVLSNIPADWTRLAFTDVTADYSLNPECSG